MCHVQYLNQIEIFLQCFPGHLQRVVGMQGCYAYSYTYTLLQLGQSRKSAHIGQADVVHETPLHRVSQV